MMADAARTYDVCIFQGQRAVGDVPLDPTLVGDAGQVCTGATKAAQRYVLEFLTEGGSMAYLPARGCSFMAKLRMGYLRHESDVFAAFALASATVLDNLAADEAAATPADERIVAAALDSVRLAPGSCRLGVTLTTAAGSARSVILPVATY